MSEVNEKIEIESITSPDWSGRVNRAKYMAMRDALIPVLPTEAPGMTVAEAKAALLPNLSKELFPGGEKAGWWLKAVQLDMEAKGVIERGGKGPVRLFKTGKNL
ncbi:hypothetical protein [Pararhizobium sp. IMCC21322]|uniref:DUF6958 family protein n=1 Tax=Pararhizobium sp. IMCC21322 TaxID=3067903 RepID=UPI0027426A5C|nr:hypothetical protein [Pararhizobium sp. IMCC21322]